MRDIDVERYLEDVLKDDTINVLVITKRWTNFWDFVAEMRDRNVSSYLIYQLYDVVIVGNAVFEVKLYNSKKDEIEVEQIFDHNGQKTDTPSRLAPDFKPTPAD